MLQGAAAWWVELQRLGCALHRCGCWDGVHAVNICQQHQSCPLARPPADELRQLLLGPRVVDFGRVPCPSSSTAYLVAHNPLPRPLHLVLDVSRHTELRGSRQISQVGAGVLPTAAPLSGRSLKPAAGCGLQQGTHGGAHAHALRCTSQWPWRCQPTRAMQVVPPGKCAKFPLTFAAFEPREFAERVELCINSSHFVGVEVSAGCRCWAPCWRLHCIPRHRPQFSCTLHVR